MINRADSISISGKNVSGNISSEDRLAELTEEITAALQAGRSVDWDAYTNAFPEYASEILDLAPALEALNDLSVHGSQPQQIAEPSSWQPPGDMTLGDFRIVREIGRGGMGVVYEAEQISLRRRVALKVLPFASMLDSRRLARFRNEAQASASLDHPNIVHVYSVGCERGVHYYAMQYVEGRSLAELIRDASAESSSASRGQCSNRNCSTDASDYRDTQSTAMLSTFTSIRPADRIQVSCRLIIQAAEALHYAHNLGIVHRDIKPSNVMVDVNGQVWITDFGLATTLHDERLTVTGDVLGTLRYMSPEQASGETSYVDRRTDVYSLGVTLYELVCLVPAFEGDQRQLLIRRVIEASPRLPHKVNRAIHRDLETIILKAISKEPTDRYPDAKALSEDLQRFVQRRPIMARRASRLTHVRAWGKRNPLVAALLLALFISMAMLSLGATVNSNRIAQRNYEIATRLYVADMRRAQLAVESGDYSRAEDLLLRHVPQDGQPDDHRGQFDWYYLWEQCHRCQPIHTFDHGLIPFCATYSPDGKTIATGAWNGSIHFWDASSGHEVDGWRKAHPKWAKRLIFSPDSKSLVSAGRRGEVRLWDVSNKQCTKILDASGKQSIASDLAVTPDQRFIAVAVGTFALTYPESAPARVVVWEASTGRKVLRCDELLGCPKLSFSPDGLRLIVGDYSGQLQVWDTSNWRLLRKVNGHQACVRDIAFSPDGSELATSSGVWREEFIAGEIKIWGADSMDQRRIILDRHRDVWSVQYSNDGTYLAMGASDGHVSLLSTTSGEVLGNVASHAGIVWGLTFSPDGRQLCTVGSDNSVRVWPVTDLLNKTRGSSVYDGHDRIITHVHAEKSGKRIYSVDIGGSVHAWDPDSCEPQFRLGPYDGDFVDVAASPDGELLAIGVGTWQPVRPGTLFVYRAEDRQLVWTANLPTGFIRGIEFSPGGRTLAVGSAEQVLLFSAADGTNIGQGPFIKSTVKCVRYSPDGKMLAFTTDSGNTFLCDATTGTLIHKFRSDKRAITMGLAFFPDGKRFVTCGADRSVKIWDTVTCQPLRTQWNKAPDQLTDVAVSPSGDRVVCACKNGNIYVWHPDVDEMILQYRTTIDSWALNCCFLPDGRLVAGTHDVRIWDAPNVYELKRLSVERLIATCHPK